MRKKQDFFSASLSEQDWLSILRGLNLAMQFSERRLLQDGIDITAFLRLSSALETDCRRKGKTLPDGAELAEN